MRQQTEELVTECYSGDLQQVTAAMKILYRIPENSVVTLFREFEGAEFGAADGSEVGPPLSKIVGFDVTGAADRD